MYAYDFHITIHSLEFISCYLFLYNTYISYFHLNSNFVSVYPVMKIITMFIVYLVVTCAAPASVSDSTKSQEPPYYYNDDLTYTCDPGYELSSGDSTRTCTSSGTWSGIAPTCSRIYFLSSLV